MIDYNIIMTGSKGNATVINNRIMIDCGVPFRALKEVYKDLQLVLLTHVHQDHFNRGTIKKLAQERPTLRWGIPKWLAFDITSLVTLQSVDICLVDEYYHYGNQDFVISPVMLKHNVPNCGWRIFFNNCETNDVSRLFYATDTNDICNITAENYDLYMIEANYTEEEMKERIQRKQEQGEHCYEWDVLKNHLSKEKADEWLYRNMGHSSRYIYMHEHIE